VATFSTAVAVEGAGAPGKRGWHLRAECTALTALYDWKRRARDRERLELVLFRLTYNIKTGAAHGYLFDQRELPARIEFDGPNELAVVLRHEDSGDGPVLVAEALAGLDPPRRAEQQLRSWRNGEDLAEKGARREFGKSLLQQLAAAIDTALRLIRWRYGMEGPSRPVSASRGLQWSDDGGEWHVLPVVGRARGALHVAMRLTPERIAQIEGMIPTSEEPFAHSLLREAEELIFTHTASALVIGIAALEVRLKELIGDLAPDAQWLVDNLPSPSLEKLIGEYLPKLPAKVPASGTLTFPASVLATIKKGVTLRNQTAHRGHPRLEADTVAEILATVRDLLWLCDYLAGHDWALQHVNPSLRSELRYV
jgi:hypothetical protein